MKKLGYTAMIMLTALAFEACNSNNTKDAKETADSLNKTKDTLSTMGASGKMGVVKEDADFATNAAISGLSEVEFSKLAVAKTTNIQLKSFANMMINDHGKVNEELRTIALSKNISLPSVMDDDHQKQWNDLNMKKGIDFDKKYADLMVNDHEKAFDLMEKHAKNGVDPELKALAAKAAPIVKSHLENIKKIKSELK